MAGAPRCVVAVGAAAAAALVALGCGGARGDELVRGELSLGEARAFGAFPLVYAGERVDGLPLTAIVRRQDTADYVSFVYGDCTPPGGEGGCAPPVEVQVWPAHRRGPGTYDVAVPGTLVPEPAVLRGSPAAFFDDGTRAEIYIGAVTVVVFAQSPDRVQAVARALRCLADRGDGRPQERLRC